MNNRVSKDFKFYREEDVEDEGQVISNTEPGKTVANDTVNNRKRKHFEGLLILILKLITLLKLRYKGLSWTWCMYFSWKSETLYVAFQWWN